MHLVQLKIKILIHIYSERTVLVLNIILFTDSGAR